MRAQQQQCGRRFKRFGVRKLRQSLAEGAISDLIVVLQKQHESCRRQLGTWRAARSSAAMERRFALIDETFLQAARQQSRGTVLVILVIALVFAGQENMEDVVAIVVPLRVEVALQMRSGIGIVFEHQMYVPFAFYRVAHLGRHFIKPIRIRLWRERRQNEGRRNDIRGANKARYR